MAFEKIGLEAIMDMDDFNKGQAEYDKGLKGMNKRTKGAARGITGALGGIAKVAGGMLLATGIKAIGGSMKEMIDLGAEMGGVKAAFEGVGGSIERMREGSLGMVTDIDLMKSFNSAAQLVSTDFAQRLPDAMGYLSKVSAATGQSMDFMLNSLVTGVGRVSPMILDNLGVQVNLTEATEEYAASIGKTAKELTKSEQQTAVMNKTMELLARNTANMPPVLGTAAQSMQVLDTQLKNFRTAIGAAIAPMLNVFMKPLALLATKLVPILTEKMNALSTRFVAFANRVEQIGDVFFNFVGAIRDGIDVTKPLHDSLVKLGVSEEIADKVSQIGWAIADTVDRIQDGQDVWDSLKSGMLASGLVSEDFILKLDKIYQVARTVFTGVRGVVQELVAAFQTGGLGGLASALGEQLATAIAAAWEYITTNAPTWASVIWGKIQGVLDAAWALVVANAPTIAAAIWQGLQAAFTTAWAFIAANGPTIANEVWTKIKSALDAAWQLIATNAPTIATAIWNGLKTALSSAWGFLSTEGPTIASELGGKILGILSQAGQWVVDNGTGIFDRVKELFSGLFDIEGGEAGTQIAGISLAFEQVGISVSAVGEAFQRVKDVIGEALRIVGDIIRDTFGDTFQQAASDVQTAGAKMAPLWESLKTLFTSLRPVLEMVAKVLGGVLVVAFGELLVIVRTAVNVFGAVLPHAIQVVTGVINVVSGVIQGFLSLISLLAGVIEGDSAKIELAWEGLKDAGIRIFEGLKDAVLGIVGALVDGVTAYVSGLVDGVIGFFTSLYDQLVGHSIIDDITTGIVDAFAGIDLKKVGKDIIDGLWSGIKDTWDGIKGKVAGIADAVTQPFKKKGQSPWPDMVQAGYDAISGLNLGVESGAPLVARSLGDVMGLFDSMIDWMTQFASAVGGASLYDAAESFEDVADGIEDLSNAFVAMSEAIHKLKVGEITVDDVKNFLDQFGEFAIEANRRMMVAYRAIGIRNLRRGQSAAKRLGKTLKAIMIDLSDVKPGDLGQMLEYLDQIDVVLRRAHDVVIGIRKKFGSTSLKNAASAAETLSKIFVLFKAPLKAIDPAEAEGFDKKVALYFTELTLVMATIREWLGKTTAEQAAQLKLAAEMSEHAQAIFSMIKTGIDALTALADYEPVADLDTQMATLRTNLGIVLTKLDELAGDFELEGLQASKKILQAAQGMLGIVKTGIDALVAIAEYEPVKDVAQLMDDFTADIWEVLRSLNALATDLVDSGVDDSATILQAANTMVGFVKPAVDALAAIVEYEPVSDIAQRMTDFEADIWEVIRKLNGLAADLVDSGVGASATILQAASQMLSIVKPGIDAIQAMAEYERVTTIGAQMGNFRARMRQILDTLDAMADDIASLGLPASAEILQAATTMIGIVKPGIDAITALSEYERVTTIGAQMGNFRARMRQILDTLDAMADDMTSLGLPASAEILQAATSMIGLVKPGIDAITALSEYERVTTVGVQMGNFRARIQEIVEELDSVADDMVSLGLPASAEVLQAAQSMLGIIKPAIDAMLAIADYAGVADLTPQMAILRADIKVVIDELDQLADEFATDALSAAAAFASNAKAMIDLVKPAVDALAALSGYAGITNLASQMLALREDIKVVIDELKKLAAEFKVGALSAAADFANDAKAMIGLIKPGVDAIKALAEYKPAKNVRAQMRRLRGQLSKVIKEIQKLAKAWKKKGDALKAAGAFAEGAKKVIDLIKPAIDAIAKLSQYRKAKMLPAVLRQFKADLDQVLATIDELASEWLMAVPDARQFLRVVGEIVDEIEDALDAIEDLGTYKRGAADRAATLVDTELRGVTQVIAEWLPLFNATRITAASIRNKALKIASFTSQAIGTITGAFGAGDESVFNAVDNWPDAMDAAFTSVLGSFDDFGEQWEPKWQTLHDLIYGTGELIIWMAESIGPGSPLVTAWKTGFGDMIAEVRDLISSPRANGGLAAVQDKLTWVATHISNVATQFVNAFTGMREAAGDLALKLERIVKAINLDEGPTPKPRTTPPGGLGGHTLSTVQGSPLQEGVTRFLSGVQNQYFPQRRGGDGGPDMICEWIQIGPYRFRHCYPRSWREGMGGGAPGLQTVGIRRPRYDPVLQAAGGPTISVNFGDVTINDTADMATLGAMVRSEIRDAIAG